MPVFQRADLLIPRPELLDRWPVIACDQFTSQPDYWRSVAEQTARVPSSYHIIFPEFSPKLNSERMRRCGLPR